MGLTLSDPTPAGVHIDVPILITCHRVHLRLYAVGTSDSQGWSTIVGTGHFYTDARQFSKVRVLSAELGGPLLVLWQTTLKEEDLESVIMRIEAF